MQTNGSNPFRFIMFGSSQKTEGFLQSVEKTKTKAKYQEIKNICFLNVHVVKIKKSLEESGMSERQ